MPEELRAVGTAINQPEAEMICQLLEQAGINSVAKPSTGVGIGFNAGGPLTIFVEADQAAAAADVLRRSPDG